MTIKRIAIENVKGIGNQDFPLNIIPNKPSLLVAPNGFGKSSFAIAFSSLNSARIKLSEENFHLDDQSNKPKITLEVDNSGTVETLIADENSNDISGRFDIHVLGNRLKPKANKRNMGGFTSVSARLEIDEIILVNRIPSKVGFNYKVSSARQEFGANGKVLDNISDLLSNPAITDEVIALEQLLNKFDGKRIQRNIENIKKAINAQSGSAQTIRDWAASNTLQDLEQIEPIRVVADILNHIDPPPAARIDELLCAYQLCMLYKNDKKLFKDACKYNSYLRDKASYQHVLNSFDTTWKSVSPAEHGGKLVVKFPEALHISNGQRDSLSFAAWLQKVASNTGNREMILVIDEVFDYLDDANLVAVQYYISNLIKDRKAAGLKTYPLILTHLNPLYFRNFTFKDQKVYFLKTCQPKINVHFKKLIVKREDSSISPNVDRFHLHFNPGTINLRNEFKALGLKETWGDSVKFHNHTEAEWNKYISNSDDYDPFAVCCYVRVKIEESVYNKIVDQNLQTQFINENGTRKKLELVEAAGVPVEDTLFLLGVIYNEGMHIKEYVDNSSPIVAKLENITIKKMLVESING